MVELKTWDEIDILIDTDTIELGRYANEVTAELRRAQATISTLRREKRARSAGY